MRRLSVLASLAAAGVAATALAGCVTAKGAPWPETLAKLGSPAPEHARIIFLRPDQRYDDASASRIVLRVDGREVGELAYGGFILADVPAGDVVVEASADNRLFGICRLALRPAAGDTIYLDVAPRPANIAAGAAGAVFGGAVAGGDAATASQVAVGSVVGGAAGGVIESAGKTCGGPYRMKPLAAAAALEHLDRLRASE